ncbi:MAG: hypothetical protein NZL91_05190 [Thermoflexales bacterium]|nr:hypothetical protein [Thermoflexales bacterium]MCS7324600.1 hypothetical protein [Thermoflexales bacterium]MCX7940080.1 hypothetical protein [Thermoflexales bacterium]MDW8053853.1 glycine cleavage system protein T [Anaerolineae bacterium]MDW8292384.1 glycine cleavage system protein T [Anaerolineae bacterium]
MVCFDLTPVVGCILLRGSSRLDFLQRMSTGDLRGMQADEGRFTVLTTPIGRMVDWLIVLARPDALLLLGSAGARAKTARWLRKHIFFNDDVLVEEFDTAVIGLFDEPTLVAEWSGNNLPAQPLSYVAENGRLLMRAPAALGNGYWLIGEPELRARFPLEPASAWEAYRVRCAYPAFPNEISEEYLPLEAGLWSAVSFSKGCYTGQEVLARMESRGQIAKKLCALRAESELVSGERLLHEGAPVGQVTSAVGEIGLGYVRTPWCEVNKQLETPQGTRVWITALVRV